MDHIHLLPLKSVDRWSVISLGLGLALLKDNLLGQLMNVVPTRKLGGSVGLMDNKNCVCLEKRAVLTSALTYGAGHANPTRKKKKCPWFGYYAF